MATTAAVVTMATTAAAAPAVATMATTARVLAQATGREYGIQPAESEPRKEPRIFLVRNLPVTSGRAEHPEQTYDIQKGIDAKRTTPSDK